MGIYLINKAQEEIKLINQQNLFQKSEIKKDYIERTEDNIRKIRKYFIETYNQYLNRSLSSTLLTLKDKILILKNKLINILRSEISAEIKKNIEKNYSVEKANPYVRYLLNSIQNISQNFTKGLNISIILNSRDYLFFIKNPNLIKKHLKNEYILDKSSEEFIGGFKLIQENDNILYNFTIEDILNKNEVLIQQEFSKLVNDAIIKKLENEFEQFIQNKKLEIEEHLKEYDRI